MCMSVHASHSRGPRNPPFSRAEISALQTKFREVQSHFTRFETCVDGLGALQQQVEEQRCVGQDGMG